MCAGVLSSVAMSDCPNPGTPPSMAGESRVGACGVELCGGEIVGEVLSFFSSEGLSESGVRWLLEGWSDIIIACPLCYQYCLASV